VKGTRTGEKTCRRVRCTEQCKLHSNTNSNGNDQKQYVESECGCERSPRHGTKAVNINVDVQTMHKPQIYRKQMSASEAAAYCTVVHAHSLSVDRYSRTSN